MTKSLYKRPKDSDKATNATPLQKLHSLAERRRREAKIEKCRSLISTRIYKIRVNNYCEQLRILKEKYPKIYKEILSEVPKLETTKAMKLKFYESQYKVDGTSHIRGWIKKQINKLSDANVAESEGGEK